MTTLIGLNILIALAIRDHPQNKVATQFFLQLQRTSWATCPFTENGFIRILGNPNLEQGTGNTADARKLLAIYCSAPGHQFMPDSISFRSEEIFPQLGGVKALTDQYLLALAVKNKARFATFDSRVDAKLIPGGSEALHLLS